jgi:peptide/nickel transport system ATP-binding protein
MSALLTIDGLCLEFTRRGVVQNRPLRGIDLDVQPGEIVGIVGETGCGKTLTGLSVLGLAPPSARITGRITFDGRELVGADPASMRRLRGKEISMVFQNPATAFNPVFTIGAQISSAVRQHLDLGRGAARKRIAEHLEMVGLTDTGRVMRAYPHELSGGMLQRAMIAMALVCKPKLIIADEPTSALDVTIARQILRLLRKLQEEQGFSVLLITHSLGVVRDVCDRVDVLYAGRVVESAHTEQIFTHPRHPYTRGLLGALPAAHEPGTRLTAIRGGVPANLSVVQGCAFADRCTHVSDVCRTTDPALLPAAPMHEAACLFADAI